MSVVVKLTYLLIPNIGSKKQAIKKGCFSKASKIRTCSVLGTFLLTHYIQHESTHVTV